MEKRDNYERMSKAELIARLRALELRLPGDYDVVLHELQVHQEEVRIQNEQLREAQQSLEQSRDRYADLFDLAPLAYVTLDAHGVVREINLTGASLLGLERGRIIGQPLLHYVATPDRTKFLDHLLRSRRNEKETYTDLTMQCYKGRMFPAQLRTHRTGSPAEEGDVFRTAITDLTEYRRVEAERRQALLREHAAMAAAELKDQFIALVSHELRTPLAAILLWIKMLRTGALEKDQQEQAIVAIEQSAEAQRALVDDLLDISRMLTGKLRLQPREAELAPVVQGAVEAVRPMGEAKGVRLNVWLDPRTGSGRVDPDRIQQVVWNLLNNAVKFTDAGGEVSLRLERLETAWRIQVRDTGRGISQTFLPYVFESFRQADPSSTRAHGGLGLGLAITRQLVELHGGSIRAESAGEGQGATFIVELPARAMLDEPRAEPTRPARETLAGRVNHSLKGLRTLLVEDDPGNRSALEMVLRHCGAEVSAVQSAAEAVKIYCASLPRSRFDVLVSDIGMPSKSGYELIREIREVEVQHPTCKPIPAVALTAYAREEDRKSALDAGFNSHVCKPVDLQTLMHVLVELTAASRTQQAV